MTVNMLAWIALLSVVAALVGTPLARRHYLHLVGLFVMATGYATMLFEGTTYRQAYIWLCLGGIWIGVSGVTIEMKKRHHECHRCDEKSRHC